MCTKKEMRRFLDRYEEARLGEGGGGSAMSWKVGPNSDKENNVVSVNSMVTSPTHSSKISSPSEFPRRHWEIGGLRRASKPDLTLN